MAEWTYCQSTGELSRLGVRITVGYSGKDDGDGILEPGEGINSHDMQSVKGVGPIPCGLFNFGKPFDSATHGPLCIPLIPRPSNDMFGRSGFLVHGDSKSRPGTASLGCIIVWRPARELIAQHLTETLEVVP